MAVCTAVPIASGQSLYWASSRALWKADVGGEARVINNGYYEPGPITYHAPSGKIFWTTTFPRLVWRAEPDGTQREALLTWPDYLPGNAIVADPSSDWIYFLSGSEIKRMSADGSTVESVLDLDLAATGLALDPVGGRLYWSDYEEGIFSANLDGTDVGLAIPRERGPGSITIDSVRRHIYWNEQGPRVVMRADLDTCDNVTPVVQATTNASFISGLAVEPESGDILWCDSFHHHVYRQAPGALDPLLLGVADFISLGPNPDAIFATRYRLSNNRYPMVSLGLDGSGETPIYEVADVTDAIVAIAADPEARRVFATSGSVLWTTLEGGELREACDPARPRHTVSDSARGRILVDALGTLTTCSIRDASSDPFASGRQIDTLLIPIPRTNPLPDPSDELPTEILYTTTGEGVWYEDLTTGIGTLIRRGSFDLIAVDPTGQWVYLHGPDVGIARMTFDGSALESLVPAHEIDPYDVEVEFGTHSGIFWSSRAGDIWRANIDGTAPSIIHEQVGATGPIAVIDDTVYFSACCGEGDEIRFAPGEMQPYDVFHPTLGVRFLEIDRTNRAIVWMEEGASRVSRAFLNDSGTVRSSQSWGSHYLAVDDVNGYFYIQVGADIQRYALWALSNSRELRESYWSGGTDDVVIGREGGVYFSQGHALVYGETSSGIAAHRLLERSAEPRHLQVDETNGSLYWADDAAIYRSTLSFENVNEVLATDDVIVDLEVDPMATGLAVWATEARIMRSNLLDATSSTTELFNSPGITVTSIRVDWDERWVYWYGADDASSGFRRTGLDDGTTEFVVRGNAGSWDLVPAIVGCPCEFDGHSAAVDMSDLLFFVDLWFELSILADLNDDHIVNLLDLLLFIDCWLTRDTACE